MDLVRHSYMQAVQTDLVLQGTKAKVLPCCVIFAGYNLNFIFAQLGKLSHKVPAKGALHAGK